MAYDINSLITQKTLRGQTIGLRVLFQPMLGVHTIALARPDAAGGWTTILAPGVDGMLDAVFTFDKVADMGGFQQFVEWLTSTATAVLARMFASAPPSPAPADPQSMDEVIAWLRSNIEFFDINGKAGLRARG